MVKRQQRRTKRRKRCPSKGGRKFRINRKKWKGRLKKAGITLGSLGAAYLANQLMKKKTGHSIPEQTLGRAMVYTGKKGMKAILKQEREKYQREKHKRGTY